MSSLWVYTQTVESYPFPFPSESHMWWFVLGLPWVTSLELESKPSYLSIHTHLSSLIRHYKTTIPRLHQQVNPHLDSTGQLSQNSSSPNKVPNWLGLDRLSQHLFQAVPAVPDYSSSTTNSIYTAFTACTLNFLST